jgi:hypothetical protein
VSAADPIAREGAGEAEVLDALLASVQRAIPADAPAGASLAGSARDLGLFELGALDPRWAEGSMELYARALAELARHNLALARLVASGNSAAGPADGRSPDAGARKAIVDALALLAGCTEAAAARAEAFAAERILFRRRLAEVPAVRAALASARGTAGRLRAAAGALARAAGDDLAPAGWAPLAGEALAAVARMLQLHGGTGLMEDSGMPELHRVVLSVVAELAQGAAGGLPTRPLSDVLLAAPGAGGVPLDP